MRRLMINEDTVRILDAKVIRYLDTPAHFVLDFGVPLPAMPHDADSFLYSPEEELLICYDDKQNATPRNESAPEFDVFLTDQALDAAIIAKTTRENPPPLPPDPRVEEINGSIKSATLGTSEPKTIAELKAMTLAEYNAWFDANFDTAAKLIGLLKRLTLVFIRKVL
jgi:hypothetical protein